MKGTRRVAVVLSGCGLHDGTEVHEAVFVALSLDRNGIRPAGGPRGELLYVAPNVAQAHVVNHHAGAAQPYETRSVLLESARIARGPVGDIASLQIETLHGAIFPGGYGAVKNLCDWALSPRATRVDAGVERLIRGLHSAKKPMAFACTSVVLAAKVLGAQHPVLAVGDDPALAADVDRMGARSQLCGAKEIVVDRDQKLISTPAFLLNASLAEVAEGLDRAVRALLELA